MILISVIIPVYNAAIHLEDCIKSLLAQTLQSCEFIFVNDGSKDESQSIIENYQKLDDRILLINQENQGVSVARNNGLEIATGIYIGFVDADDYIANDYYYKMHEIAEKSNLDIVISTYYKIIGNNKITVNSIFEENKIFDSNFIKKNIIPFYIGNDTLNAIWNKLYKRCLIDNNQIKFPKNVALGEDGWFNMLCFKNANSVMFMNFMGYYYIETSGSATRNFNDNKYFIRIIEDYNQDYNLFQNEFLSIDEIQELKINKLLKKILALLHEFYNPKNKLNSYQRKLFINEILNHLLVIKIFSSFNKKVFLQKSKYETLLLLSIKYKIKFLIRLIIAYSNYRNPK